MTIFVVVFEVAGKGIDSMGENRNLDFGATGVPVGTSIFFDELFFVFRRYRHRNPISNIALQRGKIIKLKKTAGRMASEQVPGCRPAESGCHINLNVQHVIYTKIEKCAEKDKKFGSVVVLRSFKSPCAAQR